MSVVLLDESTKVYKLLFVCLHKFHVDHRKIDINLAKLYLLFKT